MKEQKNPDSKSFKILISIMIMTWIIMVTTLLHFYLFLCFEWIKLDWHIIPYFMPKEEFEVSTISENQISWIYEYNWATYVWDSLRVGYVNFILSWTEYDRDSYSYPWYLDNVAEIAVNQYYAFKNFPTSFWEDFLYNLEFSNWRLIHCTVLDKKTWKILWDPREISWIELHDMISE
jgi:hypothetical protein